MTQRKQSKSEFEQGYAKQSGLTVGQLHELGGHGEPCDCGADNCRGLQMVFPDPDWMKRIPMSEIVNGPKGLR